MFCERSANRKRNACVSSMQKFWLEGIGLWGAPSSFSNTASLVCRFAAGCSNIGGKRAAMKKKGLRVPLQISSCHV